MKRTLSFKLGLLIAIFAITILIAGCGDNVTMRKADYCRLENAVQERDSLLRLTRSIDSIMIIGHVYFTAIYDANERIQGVMPENETAGICMDLNNAVKDWEKTEVFEYIWTKQLGH